MINNDWIVSGAAAWRLKAEGSCRCWTGFSPLHKAHYNPDGVKAWLALTLISTELRCEALAGKRAAAKGGKKRKAWCWFVSVFVQLSRPTRGSRTSQRDLWHSAFFFPPNLLLLKFCVWRIIWIFTFNSLCLSASPRSSVIQLYQLSRG